MNDGRQIRIFLVDGTPGGLLTAEIMNWTGHIVAAPRSDLASLLQREETSRTGVYVLVGDDPEALGQRGRYAWWDVWPPVEPMIASVVVSVIVLAIGFSRGVELAWLAGLLIGGATMLSAEKANLMVDRANDKRTPEQAAQFLETRLNR